ncbi:MAG: autotransporter domain-containing protein [Candidatus Rickettsia vulgarisii]
MTVKTHLLSLYGQNNLSEKLILQGIATIGFGNSYTRNLINNKIVKNKIKNKPSYSTEIILAHKSKVNKILIIPNFAIKYGAYNTGSYTSNFETQSLSVAGTNNNKTSMIIGIETLMPIQVKNDTRIIPRLYAKFEKFLHNKQSKISITSNSNFKEKYYQPVENLTQYGYKIGGSLTIKHNHTEIMTTYDYLKTNTNAVVDI